MSCKIRDKMREAVLEGRPVTEFQVVDAHTHLGYWYNFNIPWRTAEDMVRVMDKVGVECCISTAHAAIGPDYRYGNSQVIEAMRAFPGRILGYCTINPNYPDSEKLDELNRCFDAGMVAIKYHPSCHLHPIDGAGYEVSWKYAQEHCLPILTHTDTGGQFCDVVKSGMCARMYPDSKLLIGHCGFGYKGADLCIQVAKEVSNTYFDLAASTANLDLVEKIVAGVGSERVVFGTDLPFLDSRIQIGRLAFSRLDDNQLTQVLGQNARRIFGL